VGSLAQVLGIEGSAETKSHAGAEEHVVGESGNTAVVDLGLDLGSVELAAGGHKDNSK
jgi:hypothetical protein